jgi:pimeloyl-ACP methyl ester carboxylesterase
LRKRHAVPSLALALTLAFGATASADTVDTVKGYNAPGPAKYDKVRVLKQGPKSAKNVLVLSPGTSASADMMALVGSDLVDRLPGWQVWSVDRRENWLEDRSVFLQAVAGQATPKQVFDYYLGWLADNTVTSHIQPPSDASVPFAREWGMKVAVEDLHRVVAQAKRGGRNVVLGGHSLGGTITVAYATWDFNGKAGARDLSGIVLIDGGSSGATKPSVAQTRKDLKDLEGKSPFLDITGTGIPWTSGVFAELGATLTLKEPTAPSRMGSFPLLPASLKTPVPATTRGQFGYALDSETSPANLGLVQMHMGHLAESGDPRDWVDGELVPIDRAAKMFLGDKLGGTSWFHPARLTIDGRTVFVGQKNAAQKVADVRAWHARDLGVPIYAIETALGKGRVLAGAQQLAKLAKLKKGQLTLVERASTMSHLDPLAASTDKNDFLKTVVPFLRKLTKK